MKKAFILIVSILILCWISYAADEVWDCEIFLEDNYLDARNKNNEDNLIISNLSKAMPKEAIEKAFENLNAYCCETKKTTVCNGKNNKIYPESIYLFDHLLDVYLRRLDAKEADDNWENLLYGLEPDLSGKEWRQFITNRWNDVKWSLPLEIDQIYKTNWNLTINISPYSKLYDKDFKQRSDDFESQILLYDQWTLRDKYNFACDIAVYINKFSSNWITFSSNEVTTEEYNACKNLTTSRISNEKVYTQTVLMQKGNVLLWSNIKSYLLSYFISNKLNELEGLVHEINTSFAEINKAIIKLTNKCS